MADIPSTGHVGETGARRFAMTGDDVGARSAAFVAFAREEARAGRKIVALYPAWRATDARKAVDFARGSLRTDHIAGISVDLSPLALSLIADQLAFLAPYVPPGMVAALSAELPKHLLAGAWLRTVSGLSTLPTSLGQHMGSYAPTVSFLAYCAPSAQVSRLRASDMITELPFRPVQPVQLLCSTPDPSITRVFDENLPQAIQPVATRSLPVQPLGSAYWGTTKYVEFVALSAHPQALAYAAGALSASECTWCGESVAATPCPFCGGDASGPPVRADHPASAPTARNATGPRSVGERTAPAAVAPNGQGLTPGPLPSPETAFGARLPGAAPPGTGAATPWTPSPWSASARDAPPRNDGRSAAPGPDASTAAPATGRHTGPARGRRQPFAAPADHRAPEPVRPPEVPADPDGLPRPESPRTYSR
ncbi:hypothetical protein ABZ635_15790 [Nocardiopsis sp. NPDC007018]|uniref:hypothetical protein n=1 Tax=Nocardiopsis sp. NPDC007018 TaxID=3155721 RepID=UPI0033CE8C71